MYNQSSSPNSREADSLSVTEEQQNELSLISTTQDLAFFSSGFILGAIIDVLKSFIISVYLAKLGTDENAAGALISSTQMLLMSVCCCTYATGIEVGKKMKLVNTDTNSREYQDENNTDFSEIAITSFVFSNILSIPLVILCFNIKNILLLMDQDEKLSMITGEYYQGFGWGIPAIFMLASLQQFIVGHGDIKDALILFNTITLNTIFVGILGYIFAFGIGESIPAFKVTGIGAASSAVAWGNLLVLGVFAAYSDRYNHNINFSSFGAWERLCKNLSKYSVIGGAITIRVVSEIMYLFFATLLVSKMGENSLSAEQIANQYMLLMVFPIFSITQATTIKTSPYIALKNKDNITTVTYAGCLTATGLSVVMCLIVCSMPTRLISLFIDINTHHDIYIAAKNLLYINAATQIPDALKNVICGTINAMDDPYTPLIAAVGVNVMLSLALGYVLGFTEKLGVEGIFFARLLATLTAMVILQRAFVRVDFHPKATIQMSNSSSGFWFAKDKNCVSSEIGLINFKKDKNYEACESQMSIIPLMNGGNASNE